MKFTFAGYLFLLIIAGIFVVVGVVAEDWNDPTELLSLDALADPRLSQYAIALTDLRMNKMRNLSGFNSNVATRSNVSMLTTDTILVKFKNRKHVCAVRVKPSEKYAALRVLSRRLDVEFSELDRLMTRQFEPTDPLLSDQWHHDVIGSQAAWDHGLGSSSVTVAIVDYTFNMSHSDLAANVVNGYDIVNEVIIFDSSAYPSDDHSTLSAGMAAAVINNANGVAGIGNSSILPININGLISEMYSAVIWAASNGVRVVNISWTGAESETLNDAGEYLRNTTDGVLVMSGINGSGLLDYTNQPYIVAVSMTDSDDTLQSHYGPHIDFSAPGEAIYSTSALGYATGSGTSYAAPLVSGILAALFAIYPEMSADEAISILAVTAVDLGDPGWDTHYGWGRVDFKNAAWLAAAAAGNITDLGTLRIERDTSRLMVSTEFQPGVNYMLMGITNLSSNAWGDVSATLQTNGTMIEFIIDPLAETTSYKMTGELDF